MEASAVEGACTKGAAALPPRPTLAAIGFLHRPPAMGAVMVMTRPLLCCKERDVPVVVWRCGDGDGWRGKWVSVV
jgi:hypothetical protein